MALFFGLAVKEIAEALQPAGRSPRTSHLRPDFNGWGIPTATDISIAWVTALCVFGAGHPAINFLLLCAIIDDGIGLVIIAAAYREPTRRRASAGGSTAPSRALAWYGLLYGRCTRRRALLRVPFLPLDLDSEDAGGDGDDVSDDEDDAKPHRSPLHDFEHATKGFVDFGVLFAFGAVNAGVRVDGVGGYSLVVFLSLLVGKTLGMIGGSQVATLMGFPRPEGMSLRALVVDGVISSVGLTVSLFISGMAFADNARVMDQAKFGALMSLSPAVVLVCFATFVPDGRRLLLPPEAPRQLEAAKRDRGAAMSPIDEEASVHHTMGGRRPPTPSVDEEEEDLEEVIVHNMEDSLHRIHRIEARCERKGGITRAASLSFINATPSTSGSNLSSLGHGSAGSLAQLAVRDADASRCPARRPLAAATPDGASPPPLRLTANADLTPMPRTPPRR
ncbi:Na+/H+ antiporter 1 [Aureococcus anophagefferens]|nr:Na+/H+ antiporter 1 [Aureococcus anophagefferens]